MQQAQARLDRLIKPTGSLGKMENICAQLAGIYGKKYFDTSKKIIISFAGDHGVYEEGVAPDPQNITILQFQNFPKRINGVGTISKFVGADVLAVDVGINCDEKIEGVLDYKIRKGTYNMLHQWAFRGYVKTNGVTDYRFTVFEKLKFRNYEK